MTRVFLLLLTVVGLACGGSQQVEIEHQVEMDALWSVPPEAREPIADAYMQVWLAEREIDRWQYVRSDVKIQLDYARAEKSHAEAERRMAKFELRRNKAAYRRDAIKTASKSLDRGRARVRSVGKRIKYLEAKLTHAERELEAASAKRVAAQASFEYEKAKLIKKRGLVAKGFKYAQVEAQARRAKAAHQERRKRANKSKSRASDRRKTWKSSK